MIYVLSSKVIRSRRLGKEKESLILFIYGENVEVVFRPTWWLRKARRTAAAIITQPCFRRRRHQHCFPVIVPAAAAGAAFVRRRRVAGGAHSTSTMRHTPVSTNACRY